MIRTFVCLCLVGAVLGQVPFPGKCPGVRVKENFDLAKYYGRWFEYKRIFAPFQFFSTCVTAEYAPLGDGVVLVNNTGYDVLNDKYFTAIGDAIRFDERDGKLGVLFPGAPGRGNYWVLDTDYDTYTLVWSCSETTVLGFTYNTQNTWVLVRDPRTIADTTLKDLDDLIVQYNIASPYRLTTQLGCPGRVF